MPNIVVQKTAEKSYRQGYTRGADPTLELPDVLDDDEANERQLPEMTPIDGRDDELQGPIRHENAAEDNEVAPSTGVSVASHVQATTVAEAAPLDPEPPIAPASSRELRALHREIGFIEPYTTAAPEQSSHHQDVR